MSLWWKDTLPAELVIIWMARDLILMTSTYFLVKRKTAVGSIVMDPVTTPLKVNPTTLSKWNTAFQFITLLIGIGAEPISTILPNVDVTLTYFCWLTGCTTLGSGISYLHYSAFSGSDNIGAKRVTCSIEPAKQEQKKNK
jgi:phosphatidylglycerophosphate synthase